MIFLKKLMVRQGGYGSSWRDGSMGRSGSFGMGKLESLELPDAVAAVAMLHDMPPEQRAAHLPTSLPRANSGLESMQSIEQASFPTNCPAAAYWPLLCLGVRCFFADNVLLVTQQTCD